MTRFHEKLHKKSTPEEQELTLKVLSDDGRKKIIDKLNLTFPQLDTVSIFICTAGLEYCKLNNLNIKRTAFSQKLECCRSCNYFNLPEGFVCNCNKVTYSGIKFEDCKFKPLQVEWERVPKPTKFEFTWEHELEKICKSGNFIIGYIDIYFKLKWKAVYDLELEPNWTWHEYWKAPGEQIIIVECKPEVDTFQDVLRQVKTYMDSIDRDAIGFIATYSALSKEIIDLLEKEKVYVIQFSKEKEG